MTVTKIGFHLNINFFPEGFNVSTMQNHGVQYNNLKTGININFTWFEGQYVKQFNSELFQVILEMTKLTNSGLSKCK